MQRRSIVICASLCALIVTNIAFAIAYFHLQGTFDFNVVTPYVQFYRWTDGAKLKTVTLDVSMMPDDWTLVENATYGIINEKSGPQQCAFYVQSISIETCQPENLTVQIVNATHIKATWTTTDWTNLGIAFAETFTMCADEKATIKLWVLAPEDAVNCDVVFKIQVPSEGT